MEAQPLSYAITPCFEWFQTSNGNSIKAPPCWRDSFTIEGLILHGDFPNVFNTIRSGRGHQQGARKKETKNEQKKLETTRTFPLPLATVLSSGILGVTSASSSRLFGVVLFMFMLMHVSGFMSIVRSILIFLCHSKEQPCRRRWTEGVIVGNLGASGYLGISVRLGTLCLRMPPSEQWPWSTTPVRDHNRHRTRNGGSHHTIGKQDDVFARSGRVHNSPLELPTSVPFLARHRQRHAVFMTKLTHSFQPIRSIHRAAGTSPYKSRIRPPSKTETVKQPSKTSAKRGRCSHAQAPIRTTSRKARRKHILVPLPLRIKQTKITQIGTAQNTAAAATTTTAGNHNQQQLPQPNNKQHITNQHDERLQQQRQRQEEASAFVRPPRHANECLHQHR